MILKRKVILKMIEEILKRSCRVSGLEKISIDVIMKRIWKVFRDYITWKRNVNTTNTGPEPTSLTIFVNASVGVF